MVAGTLRASGVPNPLHHRPKNHGTTTDAASNRDLNHKEHEKNIINRRGRSPAPTYILVGERRCALPQRIQIIIFFIINTGVVWHHGLKTNQ
jgi:hypothetical protein